jgi:hypothetical protein
MNLIPLFFTYQPSIILFLKANFEVIIIAKTTNNNKLEFIFPKPNPSGFAK